MNESIAVVIAATLAGGFVGTTLYAIYRATTWSPKGLRTHKLAHPEEYPEGAYPRLALEAKGLNWGMKSWDEFEDSLPNAREALRRLNEDAQDLGLAEYKRPRTKKIYQAENMPSVNYWPNPDINH